MGRTPISREGFSREYQELKFVLHRKLLDRINLEILSSVASDRMRAEVRSAVAKAGEEESTPSTSWRKIASSRR